MIRFAREDDIEWIIDLCCEHATYEQASYDRAGKALNLSKAVFSEKPEMYCLVAEMERSLVGYATFMIQYSTWDATGYVYMDCLYLKEKSRGLGIGRKFLNRIMQEARKHRCQTIQWQTPVFNQRAIKFYNRLGVSSKTKERFFLSF